MFGSIPQMSIKLAQELEMNQCMNLGKNNRGTFRKEIKKLGIRLSYH